MSSVRSVMWLSDIDSESEHFSPHSKQSARMLQAKFPLVPGFVITPHAYQAFLLDNMLDHKIKQLLSTVSFERSDSLMQIEHHIKQLFRQALFSNDLYDELEDFYFRLGTDVTMEMHETGKNSRKHAKKTITSEAGLISEIINLWSEMYSGNAMWHRHHANINHFDTKAEIIVRKKLQGDKTGKIFTIEPGSHAKDKLVIVTEYPHEQDEYILSKKNLTIIDRKLKHKDFSDKLTLEEILAIAKLARRVDEHLYHPQEISWVLKDNTLYIQSISPISDLPVSKPQKQTKLPIARGKGLTPAIGTGTITILSNQTGYPPLSAHAVVVMPDLNTKQLEKLKKIRGIIIENHPHLETITLLRRQGIPAVSNIKNATKIFRNGHIITVHGGKGEIYQGGLIN